MAGDPSSVLLALDRSFRAGEYELVLGFGRDANFFLVEQYAQAAGYRLAYHGTHKYHAQGLSHNLRAGHEFIAQLSGSLAAAGGNWPASIARVPALASYQDGSMTAKVMYSRQDSPPQGPGLLVSWLFKRHHA